MPNLAQARTAVALIGMNAGMGASLAAGTLLRSPRRARNLLVGPTFDAVLAAAGVRVVVEGAQHLERPRPAIYAFNHQSNLDPLIVFKLVRRDFTSTGKAEVRKDPVAVLTAKALEAVLIDRHDPDAARRQMAVAADRLRGGESVLIAPEGTRSRGAEPGPYRTGVIHLAMETGVPIVPIALHDVGALMPDRTIFPGVVRTRVLPPHDPAGWERADARRHAEALREAVIAALREMG